MYGDDMYDSADRKHENEWDMQNMPQREQAFVFPEPRHIDHGIQVRLDDGLSVNQAFFVFDGVPSMFPGVRAKRAVEFPVNDILCPAGARPSSSTGATSAGDPVSSGAA